MRRDKSWPRAWRSFRERLAEVHPNPPAWVAVIYADWIKAQSPPPEEILTAAAEHQCGAVLLDTFHKDGRSLVEVLPSQELEQIASAVHQAGLALALAGGLRKTDVPRLKPLAPEIVAIRSAACRDGNRTAEICETAVRLFREMLETHLSNDVFPPGK